MTDLTPHQAVAAYLGGEAVDPHVLRAAVAQYVAAYDAITDLAFDAAAEPGSSNAIEELAGELLHQQSLIEDFVVFVKVSTALPDFLRRRPAAETKSTPA